MKEILLKYLEQYEGGFNHRSATRYLYKRNKKLWKQIMSATSFLPADAKAKQRCWHVLNDMYESPLCPVEHVPVKWWENRYLTYSSQSAKAKCKENTERRMQTYKERTGYDSWNTKLNPEGFAKYVGTCMENWGVPNPSLNNDVLQKIRETRLANGTTRTEEQKTAREKYDEQVLVYSKQSWWDHYSKINPDGVERGNGYELDYIYSRAEGFKNDIPPKIIGHYTNLQMLTKSENASKSSRCDKTLAKLFEDYLDK